MRAEKNFARNNRINTITEANTMKTIDFLNTLDDHGDKPLLFEYGTGKFVAGDYHITEVKNVLVESVDCGSNEATYRQTIVQLINGRDGGQPMTAGKAQSIFRGVAKMKPLVPTTEIFFEWGDRSTPTSTYRVDEVAAEPGGLIVRLSVPPTVCRPAERLDRAVGERTVNCC